MNVPEILDKLQYCKGVFPYQAINEAVAKREEITPSLLNIIEEAARLPNSLNDDDYLAPLYAMFLLAQFREKLAYPAIVKFLSVPDEKVMDYLGETATEDLNRILASVAHGDSTLIKSLAENKAINECIRSAALKTLLTQLTHGESTREEVVAYFQGLFRGGLEREPSIVWAELVIYSSDIYPEELAEDLRQAFKDDLIDTAWINLKDVEKTLARDKESVLRNSFSDPHHRYIEDVTEEMRYWDCFNPPNIKKLKPGPPLARIEAVKPVVANKKIGRNEPCPCGSGKKYKNAAEKPRRSSPGPAFSNGANMAESGEWNRRGATPSDVTAESEYGVKRDFFIKGINLGKLEYREGSVWGNPYLRILRSQLENFISEQLGENYLLAAKSQTELYRINKEIAETKKKLAELQDRKIYLKGLLKSTGPAPGKRRKNNPGFGKMM